MNVIRAAIVVLGIGSLAASAALADSIATTYRGAADVTVDYTPVSNAGTKDVQLISPAGLDYLVWYTKVDLDAAAGSSPQFSFWSGAAAPTSLLGTLQTPASIAPGLDGYIFYAKPRIRLTGGQPFWLRGTGLTVTPFRWAGTNPRSIPQGPASLQSNQFSGNSITVNRYDVQGAPIISANITAPVGTGTFIGPGYKAAGFTLPAGTDFAFDEALLTLDLSGGGVPLVSLWSGAGVPSTQISALNQAINDTSITGNDFVYRAPARVRLYGGTTYWLRVELSGAGSFLWQGTSPSTLPTGAAASAGFVLTGGVSATFNRFAVVGTPIISSNLDAATGPGTGLSDGPPYATKDAGFKMPANRDYALDLVTMDVFYPTNASGSVSILSGATPTTPVATGMFFVPFFFDINGVVSPIQPDPVPGTRLRAANYYWLRFAASSNVLFTWNGTNPQTIPTGLAGSAGYLFDGVPSTVRNRYEITGSPMFCAADFNHNGIVSVQDIFDYLAAYFNGVIWADVNGSGAVSVQDIFDFLRFYFEGC